MSEELDRRLAEAKADLEIKSKKKSEQASARAKSTDVLANRAIEAATIAEQNKLRPFLATDEEKAKKAADDKAKKDAAAKAREENVLKGNQQRVATLYSNKVRALESTIESYSKNGDEKYATQARSIQSEIDKIAVEYKKYFGVFPPKATQFEQTQIKNRREDIGPSGQYANVKITAPGAVGTIIQDAETARENRRNLQPLQATVTPDNAPAVNPNDPRISLYMKLGMTRSEAIAAVATSVGNIGLGDGGGGLGNQSAYKIFTEQETAGFANQIAQSLLGRELTADEIAKTTQSINVESKKSPITSKSIGGSTVQSGGIDERQIVKEELQLAPEFANYQQATTYFDAMLGALRGPAGGGI